MNERQAIEFILQEIKEQSRKDFELYFQLRTQRNEEYKLYLDRLREIDEREANAHHVRKPEFKPIEVRRGKVLPEPKSADLAPIDLKIERVEKPLGVPASMAEIRASFPYIPNIPLIPKKEDIKPMDLIPKIEPDPPEEEEPKKGAKVQRPWTEWEKENLVPMIEQLTNAGFSLNGACTKLSSKFQNRSAGALVVRYKSDKKEKEEQE